MTDWEHLNYIKYLDYQFTQDKIKSGSLLLNQDLTCDSLAIDTLSPVVECDDTGILDFERDTPLYYYRAGRLRGVYYVQDIERIGPIRYQITAQSAVALLDRGRHMGGIYTGQEAGEVLPDIAGSVPIIVKTSLAKQKLYGWLPIASPRANMTQALFALGASIRTELDGVLHAAFLWDGLSCVIPPDDTYREGGAVRTQGKVTQVAVTEHQYIEGGELTILFEGTAQQGYEITFNEPMYDLQATGFTILDQGANYAVLSAGSGTLTGREYIHNTRQVTRSLRAAQDSNVKTFPNATLVSLVNSAAVADRLANYYKHHQTVEESVIYVGQHCGNRIQIPDPFDAIQTDVCLESAAVNLSATLKAQFKATKGFVPLKEEDVEYLDAQMVVEEDGPVDLPDDVVHIRAVLIGGGQGGSAGYNSAAATAGTSATVQSPSTGESSGTAGVGGEGGEPGTPGQGGNILEIELDLDPGAVLTAHIGTGGNGSATPGQAGALGTATTLTVGTQVFSSANGSPSNTGYTDVITGNVYATPGQPGKKGANGGRGGTSGARAQPGGNVDTAIGGEIGTNVYAERDVYGIHIIEGGWFGGGGAAAFGKNGSDANGINGGNGTDAVAPADAQRPGAGGDAGHGGGGPGGGGAGYASAQGNPTSSSASWRAYGSGGLPGTTGKGSKGAKGGHGAIILYLSVEKIQPGGEFRDKYGRPILEKEIRRFIV